MKSLAAKILVSAAMIAVIAFSLCTPAHAQFASNLTNVKLAGPENHLLANATITFDAGGTFLYKQHSATTNQILYVSDASGTVSPLGIGANLTITGGNLVAASSNPTIALVVPTGFGVTGSPITGSGTFTINTTLSGVLKGTGSGFAVATDGTDFISPTGNATLTNKTISGANNTLSVRLANDVTGVLTVPNGGTGLALGTSGGVIAFTSNNTTASSAVLATAQIVIGGGAGAVPATIGTLGTTTTLLHGNASGPPSFSAVDLANDVTGTLPFDKGGTGLSTGTQGGVVYFSGTTTLASSGVLTNNRIVVGGGTGAPGVVASLGTNITVLHGNATGSPAFASVNLTTGGDVTGTLSVANGGTGTATLTANNIVLGNGTGTVAFLAPGTNGNIATSNGTAWVSSAASASGNVTGAASSVANEIVTWNGTSGTSIKDSSGITVSSGVINAASGNITLSATGSTADVVISPGATSGWIDYSAADGSGFRNDNRFTDGTGLMRMYGNTDPERFYYVRSNSADTAAGGFGAGKGRGTLVSPSAPSSGDDLANFWGGGFNSSVWVLAKGGMVVRTTEAWGTGANGTRAVFRTTPNGSTTAADQAYVDQNGDFRALTGSVFTDTAGKTLVVKSGSNALSGIVTLTAGAGTITSSAIDTSTAIVFSLTSASGTPGIYQPLAAVSAGSAAVSSVATDNSTYVWVAIKKN